MFNNYEKIIDFSVEFIVNELVGELIESFLLLD